jgi:hypothetical protein
VFSYFLPKNSLSFLTLEIPPHIPRTVKPISTKNRRVYIELIMTGKREVVCSKDGLHLYAQEVYGECQIVDPCEVGVFEGSLFNLKIQLSSVGAPIKVAVLYTTKNQDKIRPLRETINEHLKKPLRRKRVKVEFKDFLFDVEHTGVGDQPYHPNGIVGALNRIKCVQNLLSGEEVLQGFHRIIFVSMESDIDETHCKPAYDKPNIVFYEYFTGNIVGGMGRGPGCQGDILQLAQMTGKTYGSKVAEKFSGGKDGDNNTVTVSGSDWHAVVLRDEERNRGYFVSELCGHMMKGGLEQLFEKTFYDFILD